MAPVVLIVGPDNRPGCGPLTLRPLASSDAAPLQAMLEDEIVREAMHWTDDQNRDAAAFIATALVQQAMDIYRFRYTFGIEGDGAQLLGVAMVSIGQAPSHQFLPEFQTSLDIFLAAQHRAHGYGRRILTRLRDWCFQELRLTSVDDARTPVSSVAMTAVTAVCRPENQASAKVLGDLLIPQGHSLLAHRGDGREVEALTFAMTRAQYERLQEPDLLA